MSSPTPTIGRVVHVRLPDRHGAERWRPATVLQGWGPTCCNVRVDLDVYNDSDIDGVTLLGTPLHPIRASMGGREVAFALYGTSITEGTGVGEYRWPPISPPTAIPQPQGGSAPDADRA